MCETLVPIDFTCESTKGGLTGSFHVAYRTDLATRTVASDVVTAVTMKADKFAVPITFIPETAEITGGGQGDDYNRSPQTVISFEIRGARPAVLAFISKILNADLVCWYKDSEGSTYMLGDLDAGVGFDYAIQGGKKRTDKSVYVLTFTANGLSPLAFTGTIPVDED